MSKSIFAALVIAVLVAFPIGCGQQETSTPTAPQEEVAAPEGSEAMPMEGSEMKPMEGSETKPMEGSEMKPAEGSETMVPEGSESE